MVLDQRNHSPRNGILRLDNSVFGLPNMDIQDLEIRDLACHILKSQDLEIQYLECQILKIQDLDLKVLRSTRNLQRLVKS